MAKQRYHQACPIAYGLDVVGGRWALLIVRDLGFGPRRFSDLARGLPGLSPNLLSQRLKDLETHGILERKALPPPVATTVYTLTQAGQKLEEILTSVSDWVLQFLDFRPGTEGHLSTITAMRGLQMLFNPIKAAGVMVGCEVYSEADVFSTLIADTEFKVDLGLNPRAALALKAKPRMLIQLGAHRISVMEALGRQELELLRGSEADATHFFSFFNDPGFLNEH